MQSLVCQLRVARIDSSTPKGRFHSRRDRISQRPLPFRAVLALQVHGWHIVEHLVLLATAVVGWWPIASPSRRLPPLPYAAQLLYLFVFGMPMTVVAA